MLRKVKLPISVLGILLVLLPAWCRATGDSLFVLLPSDTIFLSVDAFGEKIFHHKLAPGQSIDRITQFYGLTSEDLEAYNPELEVFTPVPGDKIRIPVPNRSIIRYQSPGQNPYAFVPVFYVVGKGETLYSIAKSYFKMATQEMMSRNHLTENQVNVGQLLHVGWMSLDGIPSTFREETGPFAGRIRALRLQFEQAGLNAKTHEQKGVAAWDAYNRSETELFALHRYASPGSIIEVWNPWMRERIYVRVVGGIPDKMHGEEVVVVLSPTAARLLGAVDPRFYAEVRYYQ